MFLCMSLQGEDHPLLHPKRRQDLMDWLLSKLRIATFKQGELRGKPMLMMQYELDLDAQHEAASRIQGLMRMRRARERVRRLVHQLYEKRFDREAGMFYYVFLPTEEAQWTKPKVR